MIVSNCHLVNKLVELLILLANDGKAELMTSLELKSPSVAALHRK